MDVLVVGALLAALPDNAMIPRSVYTTTNGTSTTYRTDVNVTGAGYLHAVFVYNNTTGGRDLTTVRITIDGGAPQIPNPITTIPTVDGHAYSKGILLGLRFTTSLIVEAIGTVAIQQIATNIVYSLDG